MVEWSNVVSVSSIKEGLLALVGEKSDNEKWKDFYQSSTGTLFIELLSVIGSYVAYQSIMGRRESYLWDAKIRSSAVGIAEGALGYPVYRGKNKHITITIKPTETVSLEKFSVIGQCNGEDIVCVDALNLIYDEEISIKVIIGTLKEENKTVTTTNPTIFRFEASIVSEDILLFLNGIELPLSTSILDLINDYYVVLTNSKNSIDVLYLNRLTPENWINNFRYVNGQFIEPDFSWRGSTVYALGQKVTAISDSLLYYEAIQAGTTGPSEPSWPTELDGEVTDGEVIWKCLGKRHTNLYFKNITTGSGYSGSIEPIWPIEIGASIVDNDIEWQCVRDYTYSKYPYSIGSNLLLKYIELSNIPNTDSDLDLYYGALISSTTENFYSEPESIEDIKINASLYHETGRVVKGRNDYRKMFKQLLPNCVDTNGHDVSPAVVELSYVKDHTTNLWAPAIYVELGDLIMPSKPNNYLYEALTTSYTASDINGTSGSEEPIWPTTIGETVIDGQIIWECKGTESGQSAWVADNLYNINAAITPTSSNGYYYMPINFDKEPIWPETIGGEVSDNGVTWKCVDTIYLAGYDATTWEVSKSITAGSFVFPIVRGDYFFKAVTSGITGTEEPSWPKVLGDTVVDYMVEWECYDLITAEKYQKNRALEKLSSYRTFGVEPPTIRDPEIVYVSLSIALTLSEQNILLSKARTDVDGILEGLERKLYESMDTDAIENSLERLSYVKIARVSVIEETKSQVWSPYTLYRLRDIVRPSVENSFYYEAYYIREAGEQGYSQGTEEAYSQGSEPVWPTVVGETVVGGEGQILWECVEIPAEAIETWYYNTKYVTDQIVLPLTPTGYAYLVSVIYGAEPVWPLEDGKSIVDGDIYWVCKTPSESPPKCDWYQYYIIGREVKLN